MEGEGMERLCTRKIDELGRIVLPSEIRSKYGWGSGDSLSLYKADDETLVLKLDRKHPGHRCVFCGTSEVARTINGNDICADCIEVIKKD